MHTPGSWRRIFVVLFAFLAVGFSLRPVNSDPDDALAANANVPEPEEAGGVGGVFGPLAKLNLTEEKAEAVNLHAAAANGSSLGLGRRTALQERGRPTPLVVEDLLEQAQPAPLVVDEDLREMEPGPSAPKAGTPSDDLMLALRAPGPGAPDKRRNSVPLAPDFGKIVKKMPLVQNHPQWRKRVTHSQTPDWSKCLNFEFEYRYGPGDLVRFNDTALSTASAPGEAVGQIQSCERTRCRVSRLRFAGSSEKDQVPVPEVQNTLLVDYQNLSLYDSFAVQEKVLYRTGDREWHLGKVSQRDGDTYMLLPKRRRGQLLRSLADWNSSESVASRMVYDLRLFQMYHMGDPVIAFSSARGSWKPGRVVGEVSDEEHVNCPVFLVQDSQTNETEEVSSFMLRPRYRMFPKDYAQVRPFGAVVQVEYPTYQGDFKVDVPGHAGHEQTYYLNQLQKLGSTPTKNHGDQVMARDSENSFWYPAVVTRDSEEDPYIRDETGRWTGQYSIKWLDAKPRDIRKTDLELAKRHGNEVTNLLTEIRPEDCEKKLFAARISKEAKCPSVCSYWSEISDAYCSFRCVPGCPSFEESPAYVTIEQDRSCARCGVRNCRRCSPTQKSYCEDCIDGYRMSRGSCLEKPDSFLSWVRITVENAVDNGTVVFGSVSCLLLIIATWYVDMRCLRERGAETAVAVDAFATSRRLLSEETDGAEAEGPKSGGLYPLSTNLQRKPVAGLGMMFLMNFQCVIILMTLLIFVGWMGVLAFWPDLNSVGINEVEDARQQCSIAHWGAEVQNLALIPELLFAVFTYLVIFFLSIAAVVCQRLRFLRHDAENATMKDFAAICLGLPELSGLEDAEERVKAAIESHSEEPVLGVSICWDYRKDVDTVKACVDASLKQSLDPEPKVPATPSRWILQRFFMMVERKALGERDDDKKPEQVRELLLELRCSGACFVVFPSELARDKAVASSGGLRLGERKLSLKPSEAEPDSVRWASFGGGSRDFAYRCLRAILELTAVILLIMYVLKYPYARYVLSFSYAETGKPNSLNGRFLMLISIIANQIIYLFSDKVAEDLHLWYTEHKQKAYLGFYLVAMILELMMDLFFTARTTFNQLVAAGRRSYGGEKLSDLTSWHEVVQTYVMQNALGNQLLDYAMPSTFLAPFIFEPILGFVAYHLGKLVVRSHAEVSKYDAQETVSWFWVNDLSRYDDAILNLTIAVIFLAIHGGFTSRAFGYLLGCHVYIYLFDHWMLLRAMPRVKYNLMSVDILAHMMMAIPTGIVLVCVVFKANCKDMQEHPLGKLMPFETYCFVSMDLMRLLIMVFVLHASLHVFIVHLLLKYIRVDHSQQETTYAELARTTPCTWFTANPVHCLRSEYLKRHDPPCRFYVPGREHLLRANPEANCHFEDTNYYGVKPRGWHLLSNEREKTPGGGPGGPGGEGPSGG